MRGGTSHREKRVWQRLCNAAEEELDALLRALPPPLRERVKDLPILCESVPSPAMVRDGTEPDLMGLFIGNPFGQEDLSPQPTQIMLFLENIWDEAGHDPAEYREQVRQTLLHEIGHYLGLEEDDLAARDLE